MNIVEKNNLILQKKSLTLVCFSNIGLAALDVTWWYYFSKFIDFFDSFFFVLRKKFAHLSTLHVVHHGGLPIAVWFGPRVRKTFISKRNASFE